MKPKALEWLVGERLGELGQTLATAESCTGGLIAHRITNVPGSSSYFLGGIVAYSDAVKEALLGVPREDLGRHGAVSERVAVGMAEGARKRLDADWAVGVTGIAGPTGGTPDKPVGLVYIAVAGESGTTVVRNLFTGGREDIKRATGDKALWLLLESMKSEV